MKVALTVWGNRISPVFDSAHTMLVVEIEDGDVLDKRYEPFDPNWPWRLAERLKELNIKVLICGAISQLPANTIEIAGIELIPFITGKVDEVLRAYAKTNPAIHTFQMPGCRHKRHRQCEGGPENMHTDITNKREGINMPRGNGTGPQGQGSATGKGQGGCKPGQNSKGQNSNNQGRNVGQGKGRGKGGGSGRNKGGGRQ